MSTYTYVETATFTITHARHMAARVATDLKRIQRFYGMPSDARIREFEEELALLLKAGYVASVTYGFKRNDQWIAPTLRYTARDLMAGGTANDDDPGRVLPGADISGGAFSSYLIHNDRWNSLTEAERTQFERGLPIQRSGAPEPTVSGFLHVDRTYSAGGRALERATVRAW